MENINYNDKSYREKRKICRQMAFNNPELSDIIDTITDEIIRYDQNDNFCYINIYNGSQHLNLQIYDRIIDLFDEFDMWNNVKRLLIDGYIAFEKIFDDKQENLIGINPLDPDTLSISLDKGKTVWIQYIGDDSRKRILSEDQVLY